MDLIGTHLMLQFVCYWVIGSLGRFWTHRIITLPDAPIVARGPYRYLPHPNYAVTIVETFVLPLASGALALAAIMTALWWTRAQLQARVNQRLRRRRDLNSSCEPRQIAAMAVCRWPMRCRVPLCKRVTPTAMWLVTKRATA